MADESRIGMCQWSKYSKKNYTYSSPFINEEKFLIDIIDIVSDCGAQLLLPSHDETVVLAKHREKLPDGLILPIADYEKLTRANNKYITLQHAVSINVPVPRTFEWEEFNDLKTIGDSSSSFVVKTRKGNGSKGVFYPENRTKMLRKIQTLMTDLNLQYINRPIVQEKVIGSGWGVSCLYWKGERITYFTHERLEEKVLTGGTSTLRVGRHNPQLELYAFQMLDSLNWHGLAMVEFKFDEKAEKGCFIEINPRLWGSIALASGSGIDFPGLLVVCATEGVEEAKIIAKNSYKEGVVARWILGDIIRKMLILKRYGFRSLYKEFSFKADIYDDLNFRDLFSSFGQAFYYLNKFLKYRSSNPVTKSMLK